MQRVFSLRPRAFSLWLTALAIALGLVFAAGAAYGQGGSGNINGAVADATGAAIPGATVTLSNPVSGYTRVTTSDATG